MPRENSFSDSEGRSLTPDLDDVGVDAQSPVYSNPPRRSLGDKASKAYTIRSHRSGVSHSAIPMTPKDRFRRSVKRVIQLQRGATSFLGERGAGAEPGIDPRRESAFLNWGHIRQDCVIEVADYNSVRASFGRMTNREFVNFLDDPGASQREPWVKVRWINIGGISWDVMSTLALKYDIHPLALEDTLHHRDTRAKADYYSKHLFLRIPCHRLANETNTDSSCSAAMGSTLADFPRSSSPLPLENVLDETEPLSPKYDGLPPRRTSTLRWTSPQKGPTTDIEQPAEIQKSNSLLSRIAEQTRKRQNERKIRVAEINTLKMSEDRVMVSKKTMYIFLFRDGTIITVHPQPDLEFTAPVTARVRQSDTSLRSSADAALLLQGILDLAVDRTMEVIEAYRVTIEKFERDILLQTNMRAVRNLHILSADLIMHKRSMEPIKRVIYGLRRYDLDRCVALVDTTDPTVTKTVVGFMSHKSKIYLADVYDHMEYILASLDRFTAITEHLISYTFNMASYEMNTVMRRLTLITIICLPLVLLVGYFGMNFTPFWGVEQNSDLLFWQIALPLMAVLIPLFTWPDIVEMYHYFKNKSATKRTERAFKLS